MKQRYKIFTFLLLASSVLSGCVTTSYKVDNQIYKSRDEAWASTQRSYAESEAGVSSHAKPLVDRKLLVVIPTASAFSKIYEDKVMKDGGQYPLPGTPARAQYDFNADASNAQLKSVAASLTKSNIYRETEILNVSTSMPDIQPTKEQDVFLYYFGVDLGNIFYFVSSKTGKQVVSIDFGKADLGERRKSLVDDIRSKALQ